MAKYLDPMLLSEGDKLTDKDGGARVVVLEASESAIAWFKKIPEGGVFGECSRAMANKLFKNVAACKSSSAC